MITDSNYFVTLSRMAKAQAVFDNMTPDDNDCPVCMNDRDSHECKCFDGVEIYECIDDEA